jgi:hypothetical protein
LARVNQPQRCGQQRVDQCVVSSQPRLVGGAAQQTHRHTPLPGISDAVEQSADFVNGQWYQSGFGLVIDTLFSGCLG